MSQFWRVRVRDGIVEFLGTMLCVVLQGYLDVVMPNENEAFVLLRSYSKNRPAGRADP